MSSICLIFFPSSFHFCGWNIFIFHPNLLWFCWFSSARFNLVQPVAVLIFWPPNCSLLSWLICSFPASYLLVFEMLIHSVRLEGISLKFWGFFSCSDDVNFRYVFFIFYLNDMCCLSLTVILTLKVEAKLIFSQIYLDAWLDSRVQWRRKLRLEYTIWMVMWPTLIAYMAPAVSYTSGDALCSSPEGLLRACCVET